MTGRTRLLVYAIVLASLPATTVYGQKRPTKRPAILDDPAGANVDYLPGENPAFHKLCWPVYSEARGAIQDAKGSVQDKPAKIQQSLFVKTRDRSLAEICKKYKISLAHLRFVMTAGDSWHWRNGGENGDRTEPNPGDYRKAIEWEYAYFEYEQAILSGEIASLKEQREAASRPRAGTTTSLRGMSAAVQQSALTPEVVIPVGPCLRVTTGGQVCKRPTAGGNRCYKHRND